MREGYEFSKKATRYCDIGNYVEGIVDALTKWSYSTGLSKKKNDQYLKAARSLEVDIGEVQRLFFQKAEFCGIQEYRLHNKSADNIVNPNVKELEKNKKDYKQELKEILMR